MAITPEHATDSSSGLLAFITGGIGTVVGLVFKGGKQARKYEELEEKVDKLDAVHETLATIKNDLEWIKSRLR